MLKPDDMIKHDDYIGFIIKYNGDVYYDVHFPFFEYEKVEIHSDELEIATEEDLELWK